ncbi:MAG: AIR synthase family protein [Anaerolineae bacterium]
MFLSPHHHHTRVQTMAPLFPVGKLPADYLELLLTRYRRPDARLIVPPRVGEDAAVIDMGDRYLVAKSDPITFATDEIGWYVVHVNANDIACAGAMPRWFLATLLLPEGATDHQLVESIFAQIANACQELGITLAGGHTEITHALPRPLVVGHMLGEANKGEYMSTAGAQVGDDILLTKGIAVEATALIVREKEADLRDVLDAALLERCRAFLHDPGISVVRDAQLARAAGQVHAMHDPTEGGLASGLWELARAADIGLQIDQAAIPIFPETQRLCAHFGLDALGVIASGALLIACPPKDTRSIISALAAEGIPAAVIGRAVAREQGCTLLTEEGPKPLPVFARDEIARLFE